MVEFLFLPSIRLKKEILKSQPPPADGNRMAAGPTLRTERTVRKRHFHSHAVARRGTDKRLGSLQPAVGRLRGRRNPGTENRAAPHDPHGLPRVGTRTEIRRSAHNNNPLRHGRADADAALRRRTAGGVAGSTRTQRKITKQRLAAAVFKAAGPRIKTEAVPKNRDGFPTYGTSPFTPNRSAPPESA